MFELQIGIIKNIKEGNSFYYETFKKTLVLSFLNAIISTFFSWYLSVEVESKLNIGYTQEDFSLFFILMILFSILSFYLFVAIFYKLKEYQDGSDLDLSNFIKETTGITASLIFPSLVFFFLLFVGFGALTAVFNFVMQILFQNYPISFLLKFIHGVLLILGIGIIYQIISWSLYIPATVIDDYRSFDSFKWSKTLNSEMFGKGWRIKFKTAGIHIVLFILTSLLFGVVEVIFSMQIVDYQNTTFFWVVNFVLSLVWLPWYISCIFCWYQSLKNRHFQEKEFWKTMEDGPILQNKREII